MKRGICWTAAFCVAVVLGCGGGGTAEPPMTDYAAGLSPEETMLAAGRTGDAAKITELMASNPQLVNAKTRTGETPLHLAVLSGEAEAVAALLKAGADPNAPDEGGRTPVSIAQNENASKEILELLGVAPSGASR